MRQTIKTAETATGQGSQFSSRNGRLADTELRHPPGRDQGGHHPAAPYYDDPETEELPISAQEPVEEPTEAEPEDHSQAVDDALGLYLRQMGAIPLLTRAQELALARRLERARTRYRKAALVSWQVIRRVVDAFEQVQAGRLA